MKILYEDGQILVCEKPAGLPVQSQGVGRMDLVSMLKNYLKENGSGNGEPYLGIVHRLDQPVQGVLVFGKTKKAAASLSAQTTDGRMKKEYLAVVCGKPKEKEGHLVDYLLKDGRSNSSRIVKESVKGAKKAELSYRILKETDGMALASICLMTGRHHQIRVQMAGAGMPLAGDKKYNPKPDAETAFVALCARRLTFMHPVSKEEMTFESKPQGFYFDRMQSFNSENL